MTNADINRGLVPIEAVAVRRAALERAAERIWENRMGTNASPTGTRAEQIADIYEWIVQELDEFGFDMKGVANAPDQIEVEGSGI